MRELTSACSRLLVSSVFRANCEPLTLNGDVKPAQKSRFYSQLRLNCMATTSLIAARYAKNFLTLLHYFCTRKTLVQTIGAI